MPGTLLTNPAGCMKPKRSLRYAGLHPRTLRAYRAAIDRFLKFVNRRHLKISRPHQLDRQIAEFIDVSYQEGEPLSYSGHLLSAVKRFHPQLRLELPEASQFLRNWQRCYVPQRALPASWALVEGLMGFAFRRGEVCMGLLLGLGFCCLLRTSEMLAITHHHLVFHPRQKGLSVILPGSKTSQGNPQVLFVEDPQLVAMAKSIASPTSTQLLWDQGPHAFRALFSRLLEDAGFGPSDYTPYALRRGGATWWFQHTLSIDAVVARGRWACPRTAKSYVDEGTMQLANVTWTKVQCRRVRNGQQFCSQVRLHQKRSRSGIV